MASIDEGRITSFLVAGKGGLVLDRFGGTLIVAEFAFCVVVGCFKAAVVGQQVEVVNFPQAE